MRTKTSDQEISRRLHPWSLFERQWICLWQIHDTISFFLMTSPLTLTCKVSAVPLQNSMCVIHDHAVPHAHPSLYPSITTLHHHMLILQAVLPRSDLPCICWHNLEKDIQFLLGHSSVQVTILLSCNVLVENEYWILNCFPLVLMPLIILFFRTHSSGVGVKSL